MTATVERIRQEASQLPFDEREALVRVLELDLNSAPAALVHPAEIEGAWDEVIKIRIDEVQSDKARLIPINVVEAEMDAFVSSLAK